ncbi:MAG: hypothetical protein DWQ02_21380 [Bacteroidetes bacterium]|nr:MAG: hypothetical protein DWQ02_21380 [Bacteroidota bacterium]
MQKGFCKKLKIKVFFRKTVSKSSLKLDFYFPSPAHCPNFLTQKGNSQKIKFYFRLFPGESQNFLIGMVIRENFGET